MSYYDERSQGWNEPNEEAYLRSTGLEEFAYVHPNGSVKDRWGGHCFQVPAGLPLPDAIELIKSSTPEARDSEFNQAVSRLKACYGLDLEVDPYWGISLITRGYKEGINVSPNRLPVGQMEDGLKAVIDRARLKHGFTVPTWDEGTLTLEFHVINGHQRGVTKLVFCETSYENPEHPKMSYLVPNVKACRDSGLPVEYGHSGFGDAATDTLVEILTDLGYWS
jgi:hypothetical protein